MAVTLADALTDFALLAVEGQQALFDEAGTAEWRADLDQRRLWLGERVYEVAMVDTSSEISNTWMWSWANPGYGASHPAVSAILPECAKGRKAGIPEGKKPIEPGLQPALAQVRSQHAHPHGAHTL